MTPVDVMRHYCRVTLGVSCDTGVSVSHDTSTVVGENPLKTLKDARERDHPKGIDASESHGGLRFFAKFSYSIGAAGRLPGFWAALLETQAFAGDVISIQHAFPCSISQS